MSISSNDHQADVKMRWERQEGKEMVQDRLGERAVGATPATQNARRCRQVPRLQRRVKVDAAKCHACHAAAATTAPNGNQARHQSQRSAISGTPAIRTSLNEEMPL